MQKIEVNKPFIFTSGGEEIAKVLTYYGYGTETEIICPFHKDINPSMSIYYENGTFYCFGCGVHGNAVDFVSMMNPKLNDLQSVRKFCRILKSKKVKSVVPRRYKKHNRTNEELYDISWDYYYGLSSVDWVKDISDDVLPVKSYMLKRGFTYDTLNKCQAKITYNSSYPIIFPMLDNGKFKGWVCRTNNLEIEKKRKYLYNTGFSRATTLVGTYDQCDYVFVVEGYMDRLKFIQFGIDNVVAILGWKMSHEQELKLKKAGVKYIISALDNDKCGKKGTEYLKTIFNNVIRFRYLKGIKDPGEMDQSLFDKMYNKTMQELIKMKRRNKNGIVRQN